jgi:hypothetical protein
MNAPETEGKPWYKVPIVLAVYVGSSLLFGGICFGFLRELTELAFWVCVLIALPSGVLGFMLLERIVGWSDARPK